MNNEEGSPVHDCSTRTPGRLPCDDSDDTGISEVHNTNKDTSNCFLEKRDLTDSGCGRQYVSSAKRVYFYKGKAVMINYGDWFVAVIFKAETEKNTKPPRNG